MCMRIFVTVYFRSETQSVHMAMERESVEQVQSKFLNYLDGRHSFLIENETRTAIFHPDDVSHVTIMEMVDDTESSD